MPSDIEALAEELRDLLDAGIHERIEKVKPTGHPEKRLPGHASYCVEAIEGEKKGARLKEIPIAVKTQWRDWVKKHPNTLVLSVDGKEDSKEGYISYFNSPRGFRGISATDRRLESKEKPR